jgi:nitroreductase
MQDKPSNVPKTQPNGAVLKSIDVLLERRATGHFTPKPIPRDYLDAILALATQAPSGYNLQPWRFIVVHDEENRRRLQKVAFNQPKVTEAPVVIICLGMKEEWKERYGSEPDKPYPARFSTNAVVYAERYGAPWQ